MNSAMIQAQGLQKSFGAKQVLKDFTFTVEGGDVVGVLGKNGAGKTTLLELMLGYSRPTAGSVRTFGHDSFELPGAAKRRIGFVPQADELLEQLTGRDQLKVIGSFYGRWDEQLLSRLSSAWELDLDQRVRELSIGQRQKLSILLALGHHPDLLLLDEPVASLDPIARRQFLERIIEVAADGSRAVVFSSHIVSDVERLANKIWILKEGRLHWQGDLDALKESVVRIHLRSPTPLPFGYSIANSLHQETHGSYATAVMLDWSEAQHRALESQGATIEVENLSLEDIFLELHR